MKIFLSAIDKYTLNELVRRGIKMRWNLLSYYQFRNDMELFKMCLANSNEMMIDSGAHSFQKGKKVDWLAYTKQYAEFIKNNDDTKIVGFFEMDVDNIIGYDNVLKLRKILTAVSDKIIPVWHKNRGIKEFKAMCKEYSGRVVAITGFRNEDIRDEQYPMFLKEAKKWNCRVHCLGMTREKVLEKVPFDYTDSASWKLMTAYGKVPGVDGKIRRGLDTKTGWSQVWAYSYINAMRQQDKFYEKWKWFSKD